MAVKKEKGQLIVLSGPSGVGKSTVIAELLGQRSAIYFSVSYTTRRPRVGEQDGVNYNFVSRQEFERMIADDELLEYAEYVDNYYGTSLKAIRDRLSQGVDVLLDIEVQGAAKVKKRCPEALFIFIIPPPLRSCPAACTSGTPTARTSSPAGWRRPARSSGRSRSTTTWSSTTRCPTPWRRSRPSSPRRSAGWKTAARCWLSLPEAV